MPLERSASKRLWQNSNAVKVSMCECAGVISPQTKLHDQDLGVELVAIQVCCWVKAVYHALQIKLLLVGLVRHSPLNWRQVAVSIW